MPHPLHDVYDCLLAAYGPQHWWPGETPFEIMVGAILVQNTAWKNVEKAIRNLADADLLDPQALANVDTEELQELIRPAGYFRLKTKRLLHLVRHVVDQYNGNLDAMFSVDLSALREALLRLNGIGPETADSILLYAGGLPTFVVDTYTHRVLARHGWIDYEAQYYEIKDMFEAELEQDVGLYNEFHALLVRVGHRHCRKTPKCDGCPLEGLLPEGGICDPG